MSTLRIIGIDPSLTCTGWAVIDSFPSRPQGIAVWHGYITDAADAELPMQTRFRALMHELTGVLTRHGRTGGDVRCVVERTEDKARGGASQSWAGKRSSLTAPNYGIAVGAAYAAALACFSIEAISSPAPTDWIGDDIPRASGKDADADPHKVMRVRYAERVWGLERDSLGPVTYAGNVADALFIARHGLYRANVPELIAIQIGKQKKKTSRRGAEAQRKAKP